MKVMLQIGEASFADPEGDLCAKVGTGCDLGVHHLPGVSGDLPDEDRARQQDHRDATQSVADGGRVPRRRGAHGRQQRGGERQPVRHGLRDTRRLGVPASTCGLWSRQTMSTSSTSSAATRRSTGATRPWPGASSRSAVLPMSGSAYSGKKEKCCGEPVRKLGNEYLYQMVARRERRGDSTPPERLASSPPAPTASTRSRGITGTWV